MNQAKLRVYVRTHLGCNASAAAGRACPVAKQRLMQHRIKQILPRYYNKHIKRCIAEPKTHHGCIASATAIIIPSVV
jgi:hypothetical protein